MSGSSGNVDISCSAENFSLWSPPKTSPGSHEPGLKPSSTWQLEWTSGWHTLAQMQLCCWQAHGITAMVTFAQNALREEELLWVFPPGYPSLAWCLPSSCQGWVWHFNLKWAPLPSFYGGWNRCSEGLRDLFKDTRCYSWDSSPALHGTKCYAGREEWGETAVEAVVRVPGHPGSLMKNLHWWRFTLPARH